MDLIITTILIILSTWLIYRWRTRAYVKVAFEWPSNRLHSWFGWGPVMDSKSGQEYMFNYANKYGSDSVFWSGPFSFFLTSKPETIQDVLTSKDCINKPHLLYSGLEVIMGKGLVTNSEPEWSRQRKVFDKAFSNKNLYAFTPIFRKEISYILDSMENSSKLGEPIDLYLLFRQMLLRIAFTTTVKGDLNHMPCDVVEMVKYIHRSLDYGAEAALNQIYKIKFILYLASITIYRETVKIVEKMHSLFSDAIITAKNNDIKNPSYVHDITGILDYGLMAEEQKVLTFKEVKENMSHIFFAAIETTSTTLYAVICMLAMHHEWQERVYEEAVNWVPCDDNDNDRISPDQVSKLVYMDMVINETMRVLPIIPVIFRVVANQNFKLANGGQILPVGQIIAIDIYRLHRNKDVWGPNADHFNPDNFSPENTNQRHPYAFIPFTKGKRFCLGTRYALLTLKVALAELIKKFKFDTDFKYEDIKIQNHLTLQFVEEPKIKVERRVPETFEMKG